jgi:hypothetical protein
VAPTVRCTATSRLRKVSRPDHSLLQSECVWSACWQPVESLRVSQCPQTWRIILLPVSTQEANTP